MPHEFCVRLTAKIRRLGYSRRYAGRFVGFLVVSMAIVCAGMGALSVPGPALWEWIEEEDPCAAEPIDVTVLPVAYSIHR
jgi:hypothetical protein